MCPLISFAYNPDNISFCPYFCTSYWASGFMFTLIFYSTHAINAIISLAGKHELLPEFLSSFFFLVSFSSFFFPFEVAAFFVCTSYKS